MSSVLPFVKPVEQPRLLRGLSQSASSPALRAKGHGSLLMTVPVALVLPSVVLFAEVGLTGSVVGPCTTLLCLAAALLGRCGIVALAPDDTGRSLPELAAALNRPESAYFLLHRLLWCAVWLAGLFCAVGARNWDFEGGLSGVVLGIIAMGRSLAREEHLLVCSSKAAERKLN